jgi:hypothetical protein
VAEKEQKMGVAEGAPSGESDVIVGYALTEKKCRSLFSPELIDEARAKGVHFLPIDPSRPIEDQVRPVDAQKFNATPPPRSRGRLTASGTRASSSYPRGTARACDARATGTRPDTFPPSRGRTAVLASRRRR